VKKSHFASFLIVCAAMAVAAFFAGRATVKTGGSAHMAENVQGEQAVQEPGAGPQSPGAPEKPKGERKILYWRAPMDPNYISDKPGKSPMGMDLVPVYEDEAPAPRKQAAAPAAEKPKGERKVLYWRAPMDPNYISNKPGKSPMGMDLVPVYEDEISSGEVRISPAVVQEIGVTTAEVETGPVVRTIRTYGTSAWNETTIAAMNTKIDGWIEKLNVNETGQTVRQGQPLIEIYAPQLVSAQQEYLSAIDNAAALEKSPSRVLADAAGKLPEAARMRLRLWDVSDAQIAELRKTRQVRKTLTLYAPISGIVTQRDVVAGDYVKAGMNLVRIAAFDPIWVMGSIYEDEIPMVRKGMKAEVHFDALPGESFEGTVDYVYPYLEGKSRTAQVRIVLPNPAGRILPQMYGTVKLEAKVADNAVLAPANAVIRASSTDNVVFIVLGDGRFAGRKVVLGPESDDGKVMVRAGLEAGERVTTSAQFLLDSESQLRAAIQSMLTAHGGQAQ
jgi:Cu(I)/Ag(I) efflux system membrane fusion protein/cobalt-zinc-cadmium efflux system membrane fusion protein